MLGQLPGICRKCTPGNWFRPKAFLHTTRQVAFRHPAWPRAQANENRISVAPIVPNRGIITDRNGVVLAKNYSAYTLEITRSKINGTLDETIDELAQVIPIDARDRRRELRQRAGRVEMGAVVNAHPQPVNQLST